MNNSSALYALLLIAAILDFAWLLLTSLILASRVEQPAIEPPPSDRTRTPTAIRISARPSMSSSRS